MTAAIKKASTRRLPPPAVGESVTVPCSCRGTVIWSKGEPWPYISVRITVPCSAGHLSVGAIERYAQQVDG